MSDVITYPLSAAIELCEQLEIQEKFNNLATEHMLAVNKLAGERDEARAGREAYKQLAVKHAQERDEARKKLENEIKWHHQTHKELVEAQCKLLDIEYDKLKS
jgi:hypothetical protein